MKAFVINVVGDIGLVFAAFLVFRELGTFELPLSSRPRRRASPTNEAPAVAICLLMMPRPFLKSAQVPLYTGCLRVEGRPQSPP